jgi:hypothetical protein
MLNGYNTVWYGPKTGRIYTVYCRKCPVLKTFTVCFRIVNNAVLIVLGVKEKIIELFKWLNLKSISIEELKIDLIDLKLSIFIDQSSYETRKKNFLLLTYRLKSCFLYSFTIEHIHSWWTRWNKASLTFVDLKAPPPP